MARLPFLERVKVDLALPRTEEGFWRVILDLDAQGSWTASDVSNASNVNVGTSRVFIRKLKAGGYLKDAGERLTGGRNPQAAPLYRLTRRPSRAPRLTDEGAPIEERGIDTMWRSMKMLKSFTAVELAEAAGVKSTTAHSYSTALAHAGVLRKGFRPPKAGRRRETSFTLIWNVGALAPKILATRLVFDPNAGEVIGGGVAREVSP